MDNERLSAAEALQERFRNKEFDMVATAALELAAASPYCRDEAMISYAATLLVGAIVKLSASGGVTDMSTIHNAIDTLWDGAQIRITNSGGGNC